MQLHFRFIILCAASSNICVCSPSSGVEANISIMHGMWLAMWAECLGLLGRGGGAGRGRRPVVSRGWHGNR